MVKKMEARLSAVEEQLTLLQVGMENRMDQRFREMQQITESMMIAKIEALGETLEQKMIRPLEVWSKKLEILKEGESGSSEKTVMDRGKQPAREDVGERREVLLFDMRLRKLEIPIFKGEIGEDPMGWFHRVERYFVVNRLSEKDKIEAAILCLEGEALEWHQWEEERTPMNTWAKFKAHLLLRFLPIKEEDRRAQFLTLKQDGSVRAYRRRFEQLLGSLKDLSDEILESKFVRGLKNDIQIEMRMFKLIGLKEKMRMAQIIEDMEEARRKKWGGGTPNPSKSTGASSNSGLNTTTGQLGPTPNQNTQSIARTISLNPTHAGGTPSNSVTLKDVNGRSFTIGAFKRLSDNKMQNRRDKGLCYQCEEKYTPGHRCKRKELSILLYHNEEEGTEKAEESSKVEAPATTTLESMVMKTTDHEAAELSLNSLARIDSPRTIKVRGAIGDKDVVVLIDSGASHNFIDKELVSSLKLPQMPTTSYGIMLGIGTSVRTTGVCKGVILNLSNLTIINDLFPLPLGNIDVVLGVQWLMTLGRVECDWGTSEMEFQIGDWQVHLKGNRNLMKAQISLKSMMKLVREEGQGILLELSSLLTTEREDGGRPKIQEILRKYHSVFQAVERLPPV
ncbi:uncharacterized protein LOC120090832 [Benincasa hispida]|uniref:uncharacterized protein LOC120090832 n=1 Tax=Benincasa hispida TaxID=102211 RepID=UPI0018FFB0EC|nr:uncharacterized protein LOC120090832 [Benincasa hispida]